MNTATPHLRGLTDKTGKDLAQEAEWAALNDLLKPVEESLSAGHTAPRLPTVFILGPPRSGSTLLSQVLAATGCFGVTTNLVARFWQAPAFGMRLARALATSPPAGSFQSERGRTAGDQEPHEFGYFWSRWMDLGQDTHSLSPELLNQIDIGGLKQSVAAMESAAQRPLMFKNNTWFTFQAEWIARQFPLAVLVATDRDPFFIAQSILSQRRAQGSETDWWSVRPSTYADLLELPPVEQVAAQTIDIQHEMNEALKNVPRDRLVRVDYDRLCSAPREIAELVLEACSRLGVGAVSAGRDIPQSFTSTDRVRLSKKEETEVRRCLQHRQAMHEERVDGA